MMLLIPLALARTFTPSPATASLSTSGARFEWRDPAPAAPCGDPPRLGGVNRDGSWLPGDVVTTTWRAVNGCTLVGILPLSYTRPGHYSWHLSFPGEAQATVLEGTVPAAELVEAALSLQVTDFGFFQCLDPLDQCPGTAPLHLYPKAPVDVPQLAVQSLGLVGPSGAASPARLTCGVPASVGEAGVTVDCGVTGVELGVSTGGLRLTGAPLGSAVTVPVRVETRLTRIVLLGVIGLGLGVGFLLRSRVEPQLRLLEARRDALRQVGDLSVQLREARDEGVRRATQATIEAIEGAVRMAPTAEELVKAVDGAVRKLGDTSGELLKRGLAVREELAKTGLVLTPLWRLPAGLGRGLAEIASFRTAAEEMLTKGDVSGAERLLGIIRNELKGLPGRVRQTGEALATDLRDAPAWPGGLRELLEPLGKWAEKVAGSSEVPIPDELRSLHDAWGLVELRLVKAMMEGKESIAGALDLAQQGQESVFVQVATRLRKVDVPRDAAEAWTTLLGPFGEAVTAAQEVLETHVRGDAEARASVRALLRAGDYTGATKLVNQYLTGQGFNVTAEVSPVSGREDGSRMPPPTPGRRQWDAPLESWPLGVRTVQARLTELRRWYHFAMAAVILLLGSVQFWDTWTGTWSELVKAFAWGLGADVAATTLVALTAALAPRSGA